MDQADVNVHSREPKTNTSHQRYACLNRPSVFSERLR